MLQFAQGPVRPTLVSGVEHDAAVKPEGKNIGKSKDPNALNLALDAPPETGFGLLYYHDPGEVSKGSHPACKRMPVQGFVVVANEHRTCTGDDCGRIVQRNWRTILIVHGIGGR